MRAKLDHGQRVKLDHGQRVGRVLFYQEWSTRLRRIPPRVGEPVVLRDLCSAVDAGDEPDVSRLARDVAPLPGPEDPARPGSSRGGGVTRRLAPPSERRTTRSEQASDGPQGPRTHPRRRLDCRGSRVATCGAERGLARRRPTNLDRCTRRARRMARPEAIYAIDAPAAPRISS